MIDDDTDEKLYMIIDYCDLGQLMEWDEDSQMYNANKRLDDFICDMYNISCTFTIKNKQTNKMPPSFQLQKKSRHRTDDKKGNSSQSDIQTSV